MDVISEIELLKKSQKLPLRVVIMPRKWERVCSVLLHLWAALVILTTANLAVKRFFP